MKKLIFLFVIIASIGNMVYDKSFSHINTIGIGFVTIAIAINFDKIIKYLESQETTKKQ